MSRESPPPPRPLSPRQRELLEAVERLTAECGHPPTYFELAAALGVCEVRAYQVCKNLKERGYLASLRQSGRTLRVLKTG